MKRLEFFFSVLVLGLFGVFTILVRQHLFDQLDLDLTVKLQDHISHFFDTGFSFFSILGAAEIISFFLLVPLFLYYKSRGILIFLAYGFGLFIEVVGKTFLTHSGPPHLFFRNDINFHFPSSYIETLHSYPSGHSYRTVFIAYVWFVYLFERYPSRVTRSIVFLIIASLCAIMLISRVSLGEHWTTDVVGGSLLGLGLAMASCALRKPVIKKQKHHS